MLADFPSWPRKLLSLWAPWWWMLLYHSKRRENRDWAHPPSFRGWVWIHAAMKGVPHVQELVADVLKAIPLARGRSGPTPDILEANAGCIVGRAHLRAVERNDARACLGDPWAVEGQLGFLFDKVEPLPIAVPWRGAQGLVDVDPYDVAVVTAIAENGGSFGAGSRRTRQALHFVGDLDAALERLVREKQLVKRDGLYQTRVYPPPHARARTGDAEPIAPAPPSASAANGQTGFGW